MIISIADFRSLVTTDVSDAVLSAKLSAIETSLRKTTNNRFLRRDVFVDVEINGSTLTSESSVSCISAGDTLDINGRVLEVVSVVNNTITISGTLRTVGFFRAYLVEYPKDVVMGAVNLLKWDLSNRDKIGVKSESISRWSVTYYDLDSSSELSYPKSLVGFMKPYRRVRI